MLDRKPRDIVRDRDGVVSIYVAMIAVAIVGVVGATIDFGRIYTVNSQAQAAADAAALAAASQLDRSPTAILRAIAAAQATPFVENRRMLEDGSSDSPSTITVAQMRFLHSLPDDTSEITSAHETIDPTEARFVEVTTAEQVHTNWFIRVLGAEPQTTTVGRAVAGLQLATCRMQPLWICNPWEKDYGYFPADVARGRQVLAKTKGNMVARWDSGDFGFLIPPNADSASKTKIANIADELALVYPNSCYGETVDLKGGQVEVLNPALNVRFDLYEGKHFDGKETHEEYRPARNVIKGMEQRKKDDACEMGNSPKAKALPRDACLETQSCPTRYPGRVGDGEWDRSGYWTANHSTSLPSSLSNASRYQVYRYEIDRGMIPDPSTGSSPEDGNPQCYKGKIEPNDNPDRRLVNIAIINCIEHGPLNGPDAYDVPVETYAKTFMTEPAKNPDGDIYLEFVDALDPSQDDGVLRDRVQLYR